MDSRSLQSIALLLIWVYCANSSVLPNNFRVAKKHFRSLSCKLGFMFVVFLPTLPFICLQRANAYRFWAECLGGYSPAHSQQSCDGISNTGWICVHCVLVTQHSRPAEHHECATRHLENHQSSGIDKALAFSLLILMIQPNTKTDPQLGEC